MSKPSYAARVIADGATNYWRLDETTGLMLDSVGGKHGTVSGGVMRGQAGALADGNKGATFDGATGKIALVPQSVSVPYTIEGWVRTTTLSAVAMVGRGLPAVGPMPFAGVQSGTPFFFAGTALSGVKRVDTGQWHLLHFVLNGTTLAISVDGQPDSVQGHPIAAAADVKWIGFDEQNAAFWPGQIDDVALYATALTPAQILAHYQLGVGTFDSPYSKGSCAMPVADKLLLQGAVALGTVSPAVNLAGCAAYTVTAISNGAVTGGMVQIEEAHDPDYTGTWAVRAGIPVVPGLTVLRAVETAKAVRARITGAITGGSVSVLLVAAGD